MATWIQPTDASLTLARGLLDSGAVHLDVIEGFLTTSGRRQPIYVDMRRTLSFPLLRSWMIATAIPRIVELAGPSGIDAVAGGETAGIPFAALVADRMGLPMVYIRRQPKTFGLGSRIEGFLKPRSRVLLVEDMATDGGSKSSFVNALHEAGHTCPHTFVFYFHNVFRNTVDRLLAVGTRLSWISTIDSILNAASLSSSAAIPPSVVCELMEFQKDPSAWSMAHGGKP
jgi:orotate phosphoribosyltransferase